MNRKSMFCALALVGACLAAQAPAQVTIEVTPALSPNGYGSPSYDAWVTNAISALTTGAATAGTPGTPTYYEQAPAVLNVWDNFVTSYHSWRGSADPGTVFGPAFANELGNRLLFGVLINGHGTQFSIAQLSFVMDSTDSGDSLDYAFAAGGYSYSSNYVGVLFGGDNALGGGDDSFITSGLNTQLVDAVVGRGSGNGWWPGAPGDPTEFLGPQEAIDAVTASLAPDTPFDFTGTYTLDLGGGNVFTGGASVSFIPEPSTYAAWLGVATLGIVFYVRRRRRRRQA
jgi:hypothetical protein